MRIKLGIVFAALVVAWTGAANAQCYGGVQAGILFANTELAATGGSIVNGLGSSGAVGGIRGGCDMRITGSAVFLGVMGEYDWSNASFDVGGTAAATLHDQYLGAARAGVIWHNGSKTYLMLGVKHADVDYSSAFVGAKLPTSFNGLTVGAGQAIPITSNIDLGLEARWTDFQHEQVGTSSLTLQPREIEALAVLTVHFGPSGVSAVSSGTK